MLRNYVLAAIRNILKNKVFSAINILGLAVGMTGCMLIAQYVLHELSYDQMLKDKDRIFRVHLDRYNKGVVTTQWAAGAAGIGPDLKSNFPEVQDYVRMHGFGSVLANGDISFREDQLYIATENFFTMFSIPLLRGGDTTVLKAPYTIVLSSSLAKKYFGDQDPVGQRLKVNGVTDYTVTGVFKDIPPNSHMKFDALISFATYLTYFKDPNSLNSWQWDGFMTYIKLNENSDVKALESKLPAYVQKREGEQLKRYDAGMVFYLEPITRIHLYSGNRMMDYGPNGNARAVFFLAIVAGFILVIAWINYVNLATARSLERAREVGVRKVMGSQRTQLMGQFLFESFLVEAIAFSIAIILAWLLLPSFATLAGRSLGMLWLQQPLFWIGTFGVFFIGVAIAGIYPAFVLSGFKPVAVLKGKFQPAAGGSYLRKGLVVFQFATSVTLIVGTFTVYQQLSFMRNSDLGVNIERTLVLKGPNIVVDSLYVNRFEAFQTQMLSHPEVENVCASTSIPGRQPGWNAGGIRKISESNDKGNQYRVLGVDYDFVKTFKLKLVAGRDFSKAIKTDRAAALLNESAVKLMGFKTSDEAVDELFFFWGDTFKIVGVLKDYRQESLKKEFEPLVFRCIPDVRDFYSLKIKPANVRETVQLVENEFKSFFPDNPFEYFFLDDYYNQQYQADQQFGKVFGVFASLAIFIACLGLFGLSSYTVVQRTKEIGVRKVLGASVGQIVILLLRDFAILVSVAIVLAVPLSWSVMSNWLNEFATRISLSWWIFAVPSILVVIIAVAAIAGHTLRAASANPGTTLRYE